mgnify:CR=1 FL=1
MRFFLAALFFITCLALVGAPALAQSGCTGDPCVFYTPTPTSTRTPTATPGPGTPTAVPMAPTVVFPRPVYANPTSIPALTFPTANPNGYNPDPLALPSPLSMAITPEPFNTPSLGVVTSTDVSGISTNIFLSYPTPSVITATGSTSGTIGGFDQGIIGGWITTTISYTIWLTETAASLQYTETFTIATAPAWYAPDLPRPMADVGWTFETLQSDIGTNYGIPAWSGFFGYIISLPIQFIKMLFQIAQYLGPLGLFLIWLLVMLPFALFTRAILFIKNLIIGLFNLIHKIIRFIGDIWDTVPGL